MNHCKNCAHWDKEDEYPNTNIRTCKKVVMLFNASEWDCETGQLVLMPKYKDCLAFAQDGSDYRAYLITAAEFGCVQFLAATP